MKKLFLGLLLLAGISASFNVYATKSEMLIRCIQTSINYSLLSPVTVMRTFYKACENSGVSDSQTDQLNHRPLLHGLLAGSVGVAAAAYITVLARYLHRAGVQDPYLLITFIMGSLGALHQLQHEFSLR